MLTPWLQRWFPRKAMPVRAASRKRLPSPHFRPRVELLEDRLAPATFVWTNAGGTGVFSNAANWSNAATGAAGTPGNGDSLVFPLNGPANPGTVTDDLAGITNFSTITFFSNGWTVNGAAGSTIGITGSIQDTPATTTTIGTATVGGTNTFNANLSFAAATSSVTLNVALPSGANGSLLLLNGTVDLGGAGLIYSGFGNLGITGAVSNSTGTGGISANGFGVLNLGHANTYAGGTTINSGLVTVNNATALGTGTVTVTSGQVINGLTTAGTLQVNVTGILNALTLNGFGFGGNGALTASGSFVYAGAITLQTNSSINVAAGANFILSGNAAQTATGTISGPGGLTVVGPNGSTLTDEDAGSYTGVTNVLGPNFALFSQAGQAGSGGQNTGTSGYVVSQGSILGVANQNVVTLNRLGTTAFVELDGGTLQFFGSTSENFAALNLGNAGNAATGTIFGTDTVNLGPNNNTVNVSTINRTVGSTVNFSGTNFGTGNNLTPAAFGAGAALVNGILPYANVSTAGATSFVSQNGGAGTPLTVAAPTLINTFAGATSASNVLISSGGTVSLVANTTINSLALAGGSTVNLNGFTLTLNSGAILTESGADAIVTNATASPLLFQNTTPAAVEGIIQNPSGILNIGTPISTGTNLTLAVSTLNVTIGVAASSTYTGTTFVTSGVVNLQTPAVVNFIPTALVIGGDGNVPAFVTINGSFQQLGTVAAPDNVTVNAGGELLFTGGSATQSIGTLTLKSGLSPAVVSLPNVAYTLTVTGTTITSGGVALSPAAGLAGNAIPIVTGFQPSEIPGPGTLVLAPGGATSGGTTTFTVNPTPAVLNGGEQDLIISAVLGGPNPTTTALDKKGTGVLVITTMPSANYTGLILIDGGTFASGVGVGASIPQNIIVNAGGTLGSASNQLNITTGTITLNGGSVNPGLPPSPLAPSNSQNSEYRNQGTSSPPTPDFSAGGILSLHIDGYGNAGTDTDQFVGTSGGTQAVTLGGTSILQFDLLGLAEWGTLTGNTLGGPGASPFFWFNPLNGRFINAPNPAGNNIIPAANVLNNPTGFQAIVSYGGTAAAGFLTVILAHPSTVAGSTYTTTPGTPLAVSTAANGILGTGLVSNPDFGNAAGTSNGIVSFAALTTIQNPGSYTGSAGGTLVVNANGTFTYTPAAGFSGTETFSLTATDPRGTQSASFTVTFNVPSNTPPTPPTPPAPPPTPPSMATTPPPPFVSVTFPGTGLVTDVLTISGTQQVLEVVFSNGTLVQFDATGGHQLATGVRSASVAFGASGEVLVVVFQDSRLFQFDAAGTHFLGGGILSASVAFAPGGTQEVLEVVFANGTLVQFDAAGGHQLATNVRTASMAFGAVGEVMDVVYQDNRLFQYDAGGAHLLSSSVSAAGVALTPAGQEVLDVIFADSSLFQFGATGAHKLGSV